MGDVLVSVLLVQSVLETQQISLKTERGNRTL